MMAKQSTFPELYAAARAHQRPKFDTPDLVVNNSRGAKAPPTLIPAKAAPTFHALHASARVHQRSDGEVDGSRPTGSAKPVDQVNGRNPFYRPPVIIPADAPDGGNSLGRAARGLALRTAHGMIDGGTWLEKNGHWGEVLGEARNRDTGRLYVISPGGGWMPAPTTADGRIALSKLIGNIGSGIRTAGAGLLGVVTGDARPLLDAGMSINTGRHMPLLTRPIVDDATKAGLDHVYGPDPGGARKW